MSRLIGAPAASGFGSSTGQATSWSERRSPEGMMVASQARLCDRPAVASGRRSAPPMTCLSLFAAWRVPARDGWRPDTSIRRRILQPSWSGRFAFRGSTRDVRILPGIAQRNPDAPDVMRGEETQLLGALGPGCYWRCGRLHPGYPFEMGHRERWDGGTFRHVHDRRTLQRHLARNDIVACGGQCGGGRGYRRIQIGGGRRLRFAGARGQSAFPGAIEPVAFRRQRRGGARANIGNPDRTGIGGGAHRRSSRRAALRWLHRADLSNCTGWLLKRCRFQSAPSMRK